jgi:hypothetical protein
VEERGHQDQRHVDGRQVMGEPAWQIDVGDRCLLGAEMLGDISERAAEAVTGENQGFGCDDTGRDGCPPVGSSLESRVEQVQHARLD